MATNSLPNTIYPPPLFYQRLQADNAGRRRSPSMEKLVLCHQHHSSTVYDARATSVHWNALVGHQSQLSGHDELNSSNKEQLKTRLPILKALAMEILSAARKPSVLGDEEAAQTHGTDGVRHSCKKTASTNRTKHKPKVVHSSSVGHKSEKFVRECCTCGLPVRASTPKKSNTPGRVRVGRHKNTRQQPASSEDAHTIAHNMAPVPQHLPPSHHPVGVDRRKDHHMHTSTKEFQGSSKHVPAMHGNRPRIVVHMPKTLRRGSLTTDTHTKKGTTVVPGPKVDDSDDISTRPEVKTIMNELYVDSSQSSSSSRSSHIKPVQAFDTDMTCRVPGVGPIPEKVQDLDGSVRAGSISPPTSVSQVLLATAQTTDISGILEHDAVFNSPQTPAAVSGVLEHNTAEPTSPTAISRAHLSSRESTHIMETSNDHEDMGSSSYMYRNSETDCDSYSDDFMSESLSSISC